MQEKQNEKEKVQLLESQLANLERVHAEREAHMKTALDMSQNKRLAAQKDKRRYLHDGRAATLDEAIRWHGGEAVKAKELYMNLSAADRAKLIDYLGSL